MKSYIFLRGEDTYVIYISSWLIVCSPLSTDQLIIYNQKYEIPTYSFMVLLVLNIMDMTFLSSLDNHF